MRSGILAFGALALLAGAAPATAEVTLSFQLEIDTEDDVESARYSCGDGESYAAQYVNAGVNSLALLTIEGEDRVFVSVVSGSGARYVSGQYVWWVKGSAATLEDRLTDDGTKECLLKERAS